MQHLLVNSYDEKSKFYDMYNVENNLRLAAEQFRNIYIVSLFACCRQTYDRNSVGMDNNFPIESVSRIQEQIDTYEEKKQNLIEVPDSELTKEQLVLKKAFEDMDEEEKEDELEAQAEAKARQEAIDNGTAPAARGTPWMPSG
jgi:hypothetical protein